MERSTSSLSGRLLAIAVPIVTAACGGGQPPEAAREAELNCRLAAAHVKATASEVLAHTNRATESEVTRALQITGNLVPACTKATSVPVSELGEAMSAAAKTDAAIAAAARPQPAQTIVAPRN